MSSSYGKNIRLSIFGQSHSEGIGAVIDGLPCGEAIDMEEVVKFMQRRAPGRNAWSTPRKEADAPRIVSGLVNGVTCGAPLCMLIENSGMRSQDYDRLRNMPRPSHADYTATVKYKGFADMRGGGHFSGRLTAPLCFAGAVAKQILSRRGIEIGARICEIAGVQDRDEDEFLSAREKEFPVLCDAQGEKMRAAIEAARMDCDSVGGIVEVRAYGVPVGLGDPMFGGMENELSHWAFAIPAVRGIEFGAGFAAARMRGSEHNDTFTMEDGNVKTRTNNHGGILGGITSGMPVVMRVAFKPTPSIGREQDTVNLAEGTDAKLVIGGRHDPCIVPRAVPCVEAAMALAILDAMESGGYYGYAGMSSED
ncbi:MAG: chorismate synthase [Clostridiales bacterium]|nr:chorismate synthase [Clostridiales bacterium]